jgi:DNA invertase Pin-like site-specific DNA recombinase
MRAGLRYVVPFRLLADAHPGDILLIEQVDRLSRLGRREQMIPAPRLKVRERNAVNAVDVDHPDPTLGRQLLMEEQSHLQLLQ